LRALLGVCLDEVDRPALERLIASGVDEDFDLDYKQCLYPTNDHGRVELAKDVTAMTERGSIIVLGLAERTSTSVARLVDVNLGDAEAARMRQVIASCVAPMPEVDFIRVAADAQLGQWLIVVPASPFLPHAMSVPGKNGLHYFTRNGSTTRELSESEVADRYRRRFAAGATTAARAREVFDQGAARLTRSGKTWLAMALVPDRPGIVDISRVDLERHRCWSENWQTSAPQSGVNFAAMRAQTVGFRRLIVSQQMQYHGVSEQGHCELHGDGSSFLAQVIGRPVDTSMIESLGNVPILERNHVIEQGQLAHAAIAMLALLSAQAVYFSGASGDGTLVVSLVVGGDADGRIDQRPVHLLERADSGPRRVPGSRPVQSPSASWRTVPLGMMAVDARELWPRRTA